MPDRYEETFIDVMLDVQSSVHVSPRYTLSIRTITLHLIIGEDSTEQRHEDRLSSILSKGLTYLLQNILS